jgi:crotonobetainyl-CoA:carnitine CoA-transferase CaiB-like acyl-CoA transferase
MSSTNGINGSRAGNATHGTTSNRTQPATFGALQGIKVIDLSRVLGGPYCTQALADHGAHVIKLEPPTGDETRGWGPPFFGDTAWYFAGVNRNKQGIAVDLSCSRAGGWTTSATCARASRS